MIQIYIEFMSNNQPIPIKLVVVGDGAVGKTSLLFSYAMNKFPREYQPTVFDNYTTSIKINSQIISLGLWDTAGQEQYARLRPLAYTNADIFLIVYGVDSRDSFINAAKKWYPEVSSACPTAVISIVGNKIDLRDGAFDSSGFVHTTEATKQVQGLKCIFGECSALTRKGLVQVFQKSVKEVLKTKINAPVQKDSDPCCDNCQLI